MTAKPEITEADLHAWVDGELDATARAEVEAWLAANPGDAARVEDWRRQRADLRAAFEPVLHEPLPPYVTAALRDGGRRSRVLAWSARAAAAVLLLSVGAAAGWWWGRSTSAEPTAQQALLANAIGAHLVYTPEVRHPVEVAGVEEAHLVAWLSKRLGRKLKAPNLAGIGYRLVGGRLLHNLDAPAAQFMYEDENGRRITVYVRAGAAGDDTALRFATERGTSAFYWIDRGFGFAVIGQMPRGRLLAIARATYHNLAR